MPCPRHVLLSVGIRLSIEAPLKKLVQTLLQCVIAAAFLIQGCCIRTEKIKIIKSTNKDDDDIWSSITTRFLGGTSLKSLTSRHAISRLFWPHYILDHFGTIFDIFSDIYLMILGCVLRQHVANTHVQNHKESPKECSRELPRKSFSLRAILSWKGH